MKQKILVVDDDAAILEVLEMRLIAMGFDVAATDDPRRDRPERDVADQPGVAANCLPPPLRDQDRQRDPDHVHQPVDMDERRPDVKAARGRAGDVQGHEPSVARPAG